MPELPEVETIVRELQTVDLVGKRIEQAYVYWDRTIAEPDVKEFCQKIAHQTIKGISRRGKFIVISLSNDTLLVHLRMTGKFLISNKDSIPHSHERVRLKLSDGRFLLYEDQRKFGKWHLLSTPEEVLKSLGIEPLSEDFTFEAFQKILHKQNRQIKPFLLDQKFITGLGNIYVDEALWLSKIHPARRVSSLQPKEIRALFEAIPAVLQKGIANTGTSLGSTRANYYSVSGRRGTNALNVFRKDGDECPRCKTILKKIVLGQRGTHFCPQCQKL